MKLLCRVYPHLLRTTQLAQTLARPARRKCHFHHEQNCFLDYIKDPVLDCAVIFIGDVPFQYNERGASIQFVGNPTGIIFVATNRNHEYLLIKRVFHLICQIIQIILGS